MKTELNIYMAFQNNEKTIDKAIESILIQTYKNFNLILIDDASTDNSLKFAKKWKNKDKRIFLIINDKKKGLASSLNKAIKLYPNSFLGRMDADDYALPNRLKHQMQFLQKFNSIDVVGTSIFINSKNKKNYLRLNSSHKKIVANLHKMMPFAHPTIIMRLRAFNSVGGYKDIPKTQDLDLFYRMLEKKIKFHNLKIPLLIYKSSNKKIKKIFNSLKIRLFYEFKAKKFKMCILCIAYTFYEIIKLIFNQVRLPSYKSASSKN
jgi:glycosyltransferase EpsE